MANFKDLTGQRFGRLECLQGIQQRRAKDGVLWKCKCDCGRLIHVREKLLIEGLKTSCNCLNDKENQIYTYNVKNMVAPNQPEILTLELKVGGKIGIFFYDKPNDSKAEIHVIAKVKSTSVTLEDGTRYNFCGKEIGAFGLLTTYLCTVEQAESIILKQEQRILDKANVELEERELEERLLKERSLEKAEKIRKMRSKEAQQVKLNSQVRVSKDYSEDYIGQKFGQLECISIAKKSQFKGDTLWTCKCDCGRIVDVKIMYLLNGNKKYCSYSRHNQINKAISEQPDNLSKQRRQINESTDIVSPVQSTAPVYEPTRLDIIIESLKKHGGSATRAEIAADTNIHYRAVGGYLGKLIVEGIVYKTLLKNNLKRGKRKDMPEYTYFLVETFDC